MKEKIYKSGIPGIIPPNSVELVPKPIESGSATELKKKDLNGEPSGPRQNPRRYNRRMLKK
jgi:hypothetical protein